MPSDNGVVAAPDRAALALEALGPRIDTFRSAVVTAEEELRSYIAHRRGASEFKGEQALIELGPFAIGRIDPERFAALMTATDELPAETERVLGRAETILSTFAKGADLHRVAVEPGGDLRDAVKDALTYVGQVFGAARAVELARGGLFEADKHGHFLGSLPFRFWNRAERQLAPPFVVDVRGEDCLPAGLGEFLDGGVAVVLVADGPTTPAPLARLITPGTVVIQTTDPADLELLATSAHPGIALLFDEEREEQARFIHDPDRGDAPWNRIEMRHMPERTDVGRGRRAPTWLEELTHLEGLARKPAGAVAAPVAVGAIEDTGTPAAEADPADQLAAWLLAQTDLPGG
jgi:hypothetical protein